MRHALAVAALTVALAPPWKAWFGADKVKHFLMSAFVQSAAFSVSRSAGASREASHAVAGAATATVGVAKELRDKKRGQSFSVPDLAWDAAGAASAAALLNRSR